MRVSGAVGARCPHSSTCSSIRRRSSSVEYLSMSSMFCPDVPKKLTPSTSKSCGLVTLQSRQSKLKLAGQSPHRNHPSANLQHEVLAWCPCSCNCHAHMPMGHVIVCQPLWARGAHTGQPQHFFKGQWQVLSLMIQYCDMQAHLCRVGKLTAPGSRQECRGCCGSA